MDAYEVEVVKVGPSLRERAEQFIAGKHRRVVVDRLRQYRESLETGMSPEPWTALEAPAVTLLADVCDALSLTVSEKAIVLGQSGETTLVEILESRPALKSSLNERQSTVLRYVAAHGAIKQGDYRQLYPELSDETRRLDLVDLVARGLLKRFGQCRGTVYTANG